MQPCATFEKGVLTLPGFRPVSFTDVNLLAAELLEEGDPISDELIAALSLREDGEDPQISEKRCAGAIFAAAAAHVNHAVPEKAYDAIEQIAETLQGFLFPDRLKRDLLP